MPSSAAVLSLLVFFFLVVKKSKRSTIDIHPDISRGSSLEELHVPHPKESGLQQKNNLRPDLMISWPEHSKTSFIFRNKIGIPTILG